MQLASLVNRYDHVLIDLDGSLYVGGVPTPRAREAVAALRDAGKGVAFVTNDAVPSTEEFVRRLWKLGFQVSLRDVVTVGGALQHRLATEFSGSTAFVIGSPAIHRHVADAGLRILNGTDMARSADLVVVAGHDHFDYTELRIATQVLMRGAPMLAAGVDRTFPMPDGPWPGTGAIAAALTYATEVEPINVGKPEAQLFETALDRLGNSGRALVVGDRLDADLEGAAAAGLDAAIVLTGATSRAEAEAAQDPRPVAIADTLADLVLDSGNGS
jgi:glycerol 3-phosphatase-2